MRARSQAIDRLHTLVTMPRWKPHAPQRLEQSALDLFTERGYEETTVTDIAALAGLSKSTFFRHYQDKREVLFGGDTADELLSRAVSGAPANATPLQAVAYALDALGAEVFTSERRGFVTARRSLIEKTPELREREALKNLASTTLLMEGLIQHGVPDMPARVAAHFAALAASIAEDRWLNEPGTDFTSTARQVLADLTTTASALSA